MAKCYTQSRAYHFDNLHLGLNSQLVEEALQVTAHLQAVVLHLRDCEYAELAAAPNLMLTQQEGNQHQQAAIVDDPPDVDVARDAVNVAGELVVALHNQHGMVTSRHGADDI